MLIIKCITFAASKIMYCLCFYNGESLICLVLKLQLSAGVLFCPCVDTPVSKSCMFYRKLLYSIDPSQENLRQFYAFSTQMKIPMNT